MSAAPMVPYSSAFIEALERLLGAQERARTAEVAWLPVSAEAQRLALASSEADAAVVEAWTALRGAVESEAEGRAVLLAALTADVALDASEDDPRPRRSPR